MMVNVACQHHLGDKPLGMSVRCIHTGLIKEECDVLYMLGPVEGVMISAGTGYSCTKCPHPQTHIAQHFLDRWSRGIKEIIVTLKAHWHWGSEARWA